jgi:hypothetical protein
MRTAHDLIPAEKQMVMFNGGPVIGAMVVLHQISDA